MTAPDPRIEAAMRRDSVPDDYGIDWIEPRQAAEVTQRLVAEAVAEAVRKERERLPAALAAKLRAEWGKPGYELRGDPDSVRDALTELLTAEPEEGTRDE